MKALITNIACGDCLYPMQGYSHWGQEPYLECKNEKCRSHGKRFLLPTIDLKEAEPCDSTPAKKPT